jgi:hypothetical protein
MRNFVLGASFAALPYLSQAIREAARNALAWEHIDDDEDTKKRNRRRPEKPVSAKLEKRVKGSGRGDLPRYRHVYLLGKDNKLRPVDMGQITSSSAGSIR